MVENLMIRIATIQESEIVTDFMIKMAKETENLILTENIVKQGVEAVFNDENKGIYYVAEHNKSIVASLLITKEWSDWRNAWVWWIQSVYVLLEYRKNGVFSQMFSFLENKITNNNEVKGLRLYVDKNNLKAIQVYKKLGMDGNHYQFFEKMV
jgi:GNAT superfamily N-acetyltransferase